MTCKNTKSVLNPHQFNTSQEMWILITKVLYIHPANILYTLNKESKLNKCHFILGHNSHIQKAEVWWSHCCRQKIRVAWWSSGFQWYFLHLSCSGQENTSSVTLNNSEGHATTGSLIHWVCTYWGDRIPRGSSGQCNQRWTWQLHQYHLSSHWCICCNISRILKEVLTGENIIQQLK